MARDPDIDTALKADNTFKALWELAKSRAEAGAPQAEQVEAFTQAMQDARREECEEVEEALLDVLDSLTGFCSPHSRIYP